MAREKDIAIGSSEAFKVFAEQLTRSIDNNKSRGSTQKKDLEDLMAMEAEFRDALLAHARGGVKAFENFILFIRQENNDILSARPYFRESAKDFSKFVTPCLKEVDGAALAKRKFNILFAKWIKSRWRGSFPRELNDIYLRMDAVRTNLIVDNMPLAINQAKIFFRQVPLSYMEFTDFIGFCAAGLASGVDKWSREEWEPLFRSVCMGRMKGNMIESYSQTMLHFYPQDRRILYKANAIKFRQKIEDIDELADAVNKAFAEDEKNGVRPIKTNVTGASLRLLLAAASHVGADTTATDDESYTVYNTTPDESDVEETVIKQDILNKTKLAVKGLPMMQRKVMRLKGGLD